MFPMPNNSLCRRLPPSARGAAFKHTIVAPLLVLAAGCSRAPTFNIMGSFFPSWLLCSVIGILLASVMRVWFVRIKLEPQLSPLIVVYPCLAGLFTFTIWLLFFS